MSTTVYPCGDDPDPESARYPREVRLGLVLFGGVSLAIYMNGIALEFFRAVRGRGLYRFLKEITNSEIVVDIVSGTSAGGINGIFLAYALANGFEFGSCSKLWREEGGFDQLLNSPFSGWPNSVLNTECYYLDRLQAAFGAMQNISSEVGIELPAPAGEIDLFVTGTDFYGEASTEFDDGGHSIDLMEHRVLFKLKHRPNRSGAARTDFAPGNAAALGKLANITSCFPVAFSPVNVNPSGEDQLLGRWGKLTRQKYFVDGGVLANKPFTPTIQAIFSRSADRQVDRYLCYVEPDPEIFARDIPAFPPSAVRNALDSLSTLPRYQGIGGDLRAVAQHNSSVEQYRRMCKAARNTTVAPGPVYFKARLMSIADRALKGIFRTEGRDPLLDLDAKRAGRRMVNCFEDNIAGNGTGAGKLEERARPLLNAFDVYYRRRRLNHFSHWAYDQLYGANPYEGDAEVLIRAWRCAARFEKRLEIVEHHMESLVDEFDFCWQSRFSASSDALVEANKLWAKIQLLFNHLLDAIKTTLPKGVTPDDLSKLNEELGRRVEYLKRVPPGMPADSSPNLLAQCDADENATFAHLDSEANSAAYREYNEFEVLDALTYPAELVSELEGKDVVRTIRFSPLDAKVGSCCLSPKVLGRQFGAFGGFFSHKWRSNDILFGRFDGCCQLVELLLGENANARSRTPGESSKIQGRFLDENGNYKQGMGPTEFFPNSDPSEIDVAFRAAIRGCWTESVRTALIKAAHREIYIDDARERAKPADKAQATKDAIALLKEHGTLEDYLRDHYPIRKETVRNLPRWSAIRVTAKAAAVVGLLGIALLLKKR